MLTTPDADRSCARRLGRSRTTHRRGRTSPVDPAGAGTAARTTPEAKAPHPTGLCRASSNITTIDHPGKAADSPAFVGLDCTDADARADDADAAATRRGAARPLLPATPSSGPASPTTPAT